jgi:hypothetical protein
MRKYFHAIGLLAIIVLMTNCSKKDNTPVTPGPSTNPTFQTSNVKLGSVYFSFDDKAEVAQWDVKFGEYASPPSPYPVPMLFTNYSRLGDQYITVSKTAETSLDAVQTVTNATFQRDTDTSVLGGNWYNYNPTTHSLSSKGLVYLVRGSDGITYKFRIDNQAGKVFTVSYSGMKSDSTWGATQIVNIDFTAGEQLLNFAKGTVTKKSWDVKCTIIMVPTPIGPMSFPGIALNRDANVTGKVVDGTAFDGVDPATVTGLQTDVDTSFVIGTNCLSYDENTHRLSPYTNRTFVVSTTAGKRAKFRLLSYYNDAGASGFMKFEYVVK